jgi:hypothetical protein
LLKWRDHIKNKKLKRDRVIFVANSNSYSEKVQVTMVMTPMIYSLKNTLLNSSNLATMLAKRN